MNVFLSNESIISFKMIYFWFTLLFCKEELFWKYFQKEMYYILGRHIFKKRCNIFLAALYFVVRPPCILMFNWMAWMWLTVRLWHVCIIIRYDDKSVINFKSDTFNSVSKMSPIITDESWTILHFNSIARSAIDH